MNRALEAQGEKPVTLPNRISVHGAKWYFDDAQEWPDTLQASFQYDGGGNYFLTKCVSEHLTTPVAEVTQRGHSSTVTKDTSYLTIANGCSTKTATD